MKNLFAFVVLVGLSGCATTSMQQVSDQDIQPKEYIYEDLAIDQEQVFKKARDFFAESFGDSTSVVRVSDIDEGKYIGKGIVSWTLSDGIASIQCPSNYTLKFLARDNRAKLELVLNKGIVPGQTCRWDKPTVSGYNEVLALFDSISANLESYLRSNQSDDF
ncbi:DUF4468 domain-containing protein [Shewanella holmiensis]|uniref:DUF4468 domain-containing protein n=1 Tax=Shewanella holmiensis TaxID=2952222 RepID=A0A9X2WNF5_9GAMM|nr:DUF4468 domain-containing protein [Shewanella holmiensis]MCT7942592.1 DUF4468 domain-containing protein [Shewanella holmiensis]